MKNRLLGRVYIDQILFHFFAQILDSFEVTLSKIAQIKVTFFAHINKAFSFFSWILGSASRAKFPVSLSNHIGFTP